MAPKSFALPESLSRLIDLLAHVPKDSPLFDTAIVAVERLKKLPAEIVVQPGGEPQSSGQVADLYRFRLKSGYFGEQEVVGLSEMIQCMSVEDVAVQLLYVNSQSFLTSVWIDAKTDLVRGIVIFHRRIE